jgi:hypothetical protein
VALGAGAAVGVSLGAGVTISTAAGTARRL